MLTVIAARKVDQQPVESYRPLTTAGKYVLTLLPISLTTSLRQPWVLENASSSSRPSARINKRGVGARLQ
jgi:hypothetical protein